MHARGPRVVGRGPIERVEVSVDGGETWADAALGAAAGAVRLARLDASSGTPTPGEHELVVRATDGTGETQPLEQPWNHHGLANNMVQRVPVTVRGRTTSLAQTSARSSPKQPVDVVLGVEEVRADAQPVAAEVRADVALAAARDRSPRPVARPPRSRRRRVRRGRAASAPAAPPRRRRAITWSVSSPCRARIRSTPTSAMMSRPPCAMKKTGAGGVPCSSRRAVAGGTRGARLSNENGSAVANHPVTRRLAASGAARVARRGTRARPAAQPLQHAGRVEVAPEVVQVERHDPDRRGSRRRSDSAPRSRAIAQTAFASMIALDR